MDAVLDELVGFTEGFSLSDMSADAVMATKRLILDAVGCTIGGIATPPAVIARRQASLVMPSDEPGALGATVAGLQAKSTVEMAAFANTVMLRYWDFSDTGRRGGHLSEMLPGVLAMADAVGSDGPEVIVACALAYELMSVLHGSGGPAVPTALAAGKLLGLTSDQLRHAASIAALAVPTGSNAWRQGELSMWTACNSASTNKIGVFTAQLAKDGLTGPLQPFTGRRGLMATVGEGEKKLGLELPYKDELAVLQSSFKFFPIQDDAQGQIPMMLRLRERVPSVDDVVEIRVDNYHNAYAVDGTRLDPNKWDPQTREMADHSLPYTLSVSLVDGVLNIDSFRAERVKDPALRPVMEKVEMYLDEEYRSKFPVERNNKLTIRLRSGEVLEEHTTYPFGHPLNPPTDEQLNEKFDSLSAWSTDEHEIVREIRDQIWTLESQKDLSGFFSSFGRLKSNNNTLGFDD